MANYAIVEIGGKQYKVEPGKELLVEHLGQTSGVVNFDKVLLVSENGQSKVGAPYVSGISIRATVLGAEKGDKIHVRKFKAKSRYRRHTGFRAKLTRIKVESIGGSAVREKTSAAQVRPAEQAGSKRRTVKSTKRAVGRKK